MASYICKCGRVVNKTALASNTGNRDTAGCEGCPYLLPWGPTLFGTKADGSKGYHMDVKGYECRMSPVIDYATTYYGSADDKTTLRIVSLDLDFLSEIQAWMDKHAGGQLFGGFSRQNIRSTDYSSGGRYSLSIACAQNKQGMAAKAALIQKFFKPDKSRRGKTPEQEKAIVLAAIEAGKAAYQRKKENMRYIIGENLENDCVYAYAAKEFWVYDKQARRWYTSGFCREQYERAKQKLPRLTPEDFLADSSDYSLLDDYEIPSAALNALQEAVKSGKREVAPFEPTSLACSCAGCKREDCTCAGGHDAAGRAGCDGEQNCAQSGCTYAAKHRANPIPADADASPCAPGASDVPPSPSQSAAADAQQGANDDLPEVCRGCQCATCGNEDCSTPCHQKSDEVEECEQFGPMADGCEDYQPKEDAKCLKKPAPNGDAAASTDANAAQEPQLEETPITPTNASSSSAPASLADAGAATQSMCAAAPASLAAEPASAFDFSSLGELAAQAAEADEQFNLHYGRAQDEYLIACIYMARVHELTAKAGRYGGGTWTAWYQSKGISEGTKTRMLETGYGFKYSTVEDLKNLPAITRKDLNLIARQGASEQVLEAAKENGSECVQEIVAQLKSEQEARKKAERQLADAQREHQAERESTSALLRDEQQRRQKAEEGRIAAEKDKADARRRAEEAEAQCAKDAALVDKLQGYLLQRDNEVAEQKERADAAEIRAQQAESRPVEVAVQAPDPAEVQRLASEKAAEMTAMLKAQLHALQTQLDDAESRADAAENSAYMSAAEFADKSADIIDGIRATFWAMAKELPDADFNQALEPLDVAVSRIYNREWEDGWNDSWENNEEDDEQ